MWSVKPPVTTSGKTFEMCAERIRSAALKAGMLAIKPDIILLSLNYDARAKDGGLHLVKAHSAGIKGVAGTDLIKNYTGRMVPKTMPARAVYDSLKNLPRNDRCPFCKYGTVESLDHVLPKESFPGLSVNPKNLVACCNRCNKGKLNSVPTGPGDSVFHPYYDNVDQHIWLVADIIQSKPAAALFRVIDVPGMERNMLLRIKNQFTSLKLDRLYSNVSAEEIAEVQEELEEVHTAGGSASVAEHLSRRARSKRRIDNNSWQSALFDSLALSNWYCSGGFRGA